jgi:hypothetical protein
MQRIIRETGNPTTTLSIHSFSTNVSLQKQTSVSVNTEIHQYATRQQSNFHQPPAYLTKYQMGICYLGIKVFNKLPPYIKGEFENIRKFKWRLKNFLHEKSFYSLQEYFDLENKEMLKA